MTEDELYDVLQPIVVLVTGLAADHVIKADPNEGAPTGPYAAIRVMQDINERGQANIIRKTSATPLSVDNDIRAQIIAKCDINFYRGNAMSTAQKLKQVNKRSDISATLFKAKVGWQRTSGVVNLTTLQSNQQEARSQISIFLMYETSDSITINSIESVQYEIQYPDGTVVETGTVTTPDAP
jgi:hypothetical protein